MEWEVINSGYRIVVVYMHGVHVAAVRFCLARLNGENPYYENEDAFLL